MQLDIGCAIKMHTQVPVAMGSKKSGLEYKARALLHGACLELHPPLAVTLGPFLQNVISFTTDLGVEAGLADVFCSLGDALPDWMSQSVVGAQLELDTSTPDMPQGSSIDFSSLGMDSSGTPPSMSILKNNRCMMYERCLTMNPYEATPLS